MRTMEFAIRLMKIKQPQQNSGQVIHSLDSELGIFLCCGKVMFGKRVCVASCLALNIKYDKAPNRPIRGNREIHYWEILEFIFSYVKFMTVVTTGKTVYVGSTTSGLLLLIYILIM